MYIERDKLLRQLEIVPLDGRYIDIEAVEGLVRDMPAAEVAPVVRCRECKHGNPTYSGDVKYCTKFECEEYFPADHYCSYGERRDNDG